MVVKLSGRIGHKGLHKRCITAEVGDALSVYVRGLEDDVVENDYE